MVEREASNKSTSLKVSKLNYANRTYVVTDLPWQYFQYHIIDFNACFVWFYDHVASPFKYVKHRMDELDKENFVCKYTLIEGDPLGDKLECISYEVKFEAASDGGCISKMTSNYKTIGDFEIKEEEIKAGKDSAIGVYKVVEAYLLENPQVYA